MAIERRRALRLLLQRCRGNAPLSPRRGTVRVPQCRGCGDPPTPRQGPFRAPRPAPVHSASPGAVGQPLRCPMSPAQPLLVSRHAARGLAGYRPRGHVQGAAPGPVPAEGPGARGSSRDSVCWWLGALCQCPLPTCTSPPSEPLAMAPRTRHQPGCHPRAGAGLQAPPPHALLVPHSHGGSHRGQRLPGTLSRPGLCSSGDPWEGEWGARRPGPRSSLPWHCRQCSLPWPQSLEGDSPLPHAAVPAGCRRTRHPPCAWLQDLAGKRWVAWGKWPVPVPLAPGTPGGPSEGWGWGTPPGTARSTACPARTHVHHAHTHVCMHTHTRAQTSAAQRELPFPSGRKVLPPARTPRAAHPRIPDWSGGDRATPSTPHSG